jgi:hypothetical protein
MTTATLSITPVDLQRLEVSLAGLNEYLDGYPCPELERRIEDLERAIDSIKISNPPIK